MLEEPIIIQMNINRYQVMPKHRLEAEERVRVERLLAEAKQQLVLATFLGISGGRGGWVRR